MNASSLLQDLMSSLFSRASARAITTDGRSFGELFHELLSERGEIAGYRIANAILERYRQADPAGKLAFFETLNEEFDIDPETVQTLARVYAEDHDAESYRALVSSVQPARRNLLERINQLPGATADLVSMREDLLRLLPDHPHLKRTDLDFKYKFSSWFNRGFLVLRPINWMTPANILEKIIEYEAVHAINDWDDLRRRLQPEDRRCFAFFHPSIPDDPLIFVEVAICKGIANSIQTVLSEDRDILDNAKADTAVFYSISNCQNGLAGISFGNSLIKQVVQDLSMELPTIKTCVTLSPLPGFSAWLEEEKDKGDLAAAALLEKRNEALVKGETGPLAPLATNLKILAARYLSGEKRPDGFPRDPVARFHLSNGATLHDVHAGADFSPKGLKQSCGVMTNYLYDLTRVEKNHEDFVKEGKVPTSKAIDNLIKSKLTELPANLAKSEDAKTDPSKALRSEADHAQ